MVNFCHKQVLNALLCTQYFSLHFSNHFLIVYGSVSPEEYLNQVTFLLKGFSVALHDLWESSKSLVFTDLYNLTQCGYLDFVHFTMSQASFKCLYVTFLLLLLLPNDKVVSRTWPPVRPQALRPIFSAKLSQE